MHIIHAAQARRSQHVSSNVCGVEVERRSRLWPNDGSGQAGVLAFSEITMLVAIHSRCEQLLALLFVVSGGMKTC